MFKHRTSRYNFLDHLDDTLTGNQRLMHVKDRLRQCQAVFLNLKMALTKIEKQRILFLRRQQHPSGTTAAHRHASRSFVFNSSHGNERTRTSIDLHLKRPAISHEQ